MSEVALIFPHQLFKQQPVLRDKRQVYLVEEWLFFRQYNFHKQKLILHRSCMKYYEAFLKENGVTVEYIDSTDRRNDVRELIATLHSQKIIGIHISDVADCWLLKRIKSACDKYSIALTVYPSPSFLNTMDDVADYFDKKKTYFQTDFYIAQRKKRNLLLEPDSKPTGGKWTFDAENRKKFPKKETVPAVHFQTGSIYIKEAKEFVQQHFAQNYGHTEVSHFFACGFKEAEDWLHDFLKYRFEKFGMYEDAIVSHENILHHSVLTPMLNTGMLTPQQIVDAALKHAEKYNTPLNSLEGFIRQVTGWREFIRIVYEREGSRQRTTNYWNFKRKIPPAFWKGETGILPIDITIKKILHTGYCHHIERLMVLGNFMLLCEFDPDEVYKWFMELFIDAYDWVMVPNVYGMTQFADGGLMTTKPYISGSNYLMKMSDYPKGDWQILWDGLFWRFMHVHRSFFLQNPRLGMLIGTFDKMSAEKRKIHLATAEKYLNRL
ncbi:MAG: cryptochrome/photolyase family protein [Bacteroidota bacterium]|nr:cryptochrome/photolyase family protein [Bacteroidota bacterium]